VHATIQKFGYPRTLVHERDGWVVLARRGQVSAGSLVLVCKEDVASLGTVSDSAWSAFGRVCAELESALAKAFQPASSITSH
jgi:diadenosine tetraphosphate (Ap4A) HIT family hydrolase